MRSQSSGKAKHSDRNASMKTRVRQEVSQSQQEIGVKGDRLWLETRYG